jgi:hypothetical protein
VVNRWIISTARNKAATTAPRMNGHVSSWHTTESEIRTLSAMNTPLY